MIDVINNLNTDTQRPKPVVLIILDGWGVAPASMSNAISQADTVNFDKYCQNYFCTVLQASGESVGLVYNEMGNSEVGHLNIGAGKIVYQNLPRINKSIVDGSFFNNPAFLSACEHVKKNSSKLHLISLLSTGGVHASTDHLYALLELAKQQNVKDVFIHAILDGRDMGYNTGLNLISELVKKLKQIQIGAIATVCGRWWAMDRDNRWERTQAAYLAMVKGKTDISNTDAVQAVKDSYAKKVYDEEFKPTVITNKEGQVLSKISAQDSIVFVNFRADRARQLTKAFVLPSFDKFDREGYLSELYFVTMVQYDKSLPVEVAFPPEAIKEPLAKVISAAGLKQLHIAETEKYAHVTYFINGGQEEAFTNEDHILIQSPAVADYAQTPEMSAIEIKNKVLKEISDKNYDFVVVNLANPDMVGHTGNLKATIKAIESVDKCLGEIVEAVLSLSGVIVITADHGNAEELINLQTGEIDKEHSTYPVPFLLVGANFKNNDSQLDKINLSLLTPAGILADVAPTILKIMNLPKPAEMNGRALI